MDVTFPMALIETGHYTPKLCARHGEAAAALWPVGSGTVPDWPFCRRCVQTRRNLRVVAVAVAVVPVIAMIAGIVLSAEDMLPAGPWENIVTGAVLLGLLASWVLVTRTSPSRLAGAAVTDSHMWLVIQGVHPAFAAHAGDLLRAAEREQPVLPPRQPVFPLAEGQLD